MTGIFATRRLDGEGKSGTDELIGENCLFRLRHDTDRSCSVNEARSNSSGFDRMKATNVHYLM